MTTLETIEHEAILTAAHHDFEKSLNSYAFFKTSDHALGEGLVQDTFVKTWNYLQKGGKVEVMKAFLYHILNNLIIDEYRKRKTTSLDTLLEKGFEPGQDNRDTQYNVLDGEIALKLIARLPLSSQKIMRMRFIQDLSLQEMSNETGLSKNTMAVQVHRGLAKLKVLYRPA